MTKKSKLPRANKQIDCTNVRLVDEDGTMLGVVSIGQAVSQAQDKALDLVEISPNSEPPVCKIMDFGRFKYELKKKANEAKKKQKTSTTKEIKLRPNIGENDLRIKLKSVEKFITNGDKVKITMKFKGREIVHQEIGMNILKRIIEEVSPIAKAEVEPKFEGRQLFIQVAPK